MTALAWFEARKVARNPFVWVGAALLVAVALLNAWGYWPSVPEDGEYVHEGLVVLAAFALLVGAWVGLRDRTSGAEGLIGSTPLRGRGLLAPARMAALSVVAAAACALAFAAMAILSFARGGHGLPDPFLVVDSALYVALAACGGFAIGYLTGSRILSLLAAPILPGIVFFLQGSQSGRVTDPSWLLPSPRLPGRFGPLGFLPDVFPVHSAYLAGGLLVLTGAVWIAAGRRESSPAARTGFAVSAAGAVVLVAGGAWLAGQPQEVHVFGPSPSDWIEIHSPGDYDLLASAAKKASMDSGRVLATDCVEDDGVTACVFPEYGKRLASAIARDAAPLAAFASLEGVPQTIRMVPTAEHGGVEQCRGDDELYVSGRRWSVEFQRFEKVAEAAFYCATYGPRQLVNPVANALTGWFYVRVSEGRTGDEYVRVLRRGWGPRAAETVGHLADVPVAEVIERLEPIWDEVRAREASLAELREALGAPR